MKGDLLSRSITSIRGIGPGRASLLGRLGVSNVADLLHFLPREYQDRSCRTPIAELKPGRIATVIGRICRGRVVRRPGRPPAAEILVADESGEVRTLWFRQPYMVKRLPPGAKVLLHGRVGIGLPLTMAVPEYELLPGEEDLAPGPPVEVLVPIYPLTSGLGQRIVRSAVREALERLGDEVPSAVPKEVRDRQGLLSSAEAVRLVHFPESLSQAAEARRYFAFKELFVMQLGIALRRQRVKQANKLRVLNIGPRVRERIWRRLPFALTKDQEKALSEILEDMASSLPMNRLLQGEVGSGKTVVAFCACLAAVANGLQAAFMAPTEILAEQHFRTFSELLRGSRVGVTLHTGGLDALTRRRNLEQIKKGEADIIVGTHALTEGDVSFFRLGLVVVDEQHKFGVLQRGLLYWKGGMPDVLVMTATPIPRTLALSVFSDLDISTIRALPPGRGGVRTHCVGWASRDATYRFLEKRLDEGAQAFIICPSIGATEEGRLEGAAERARALKSGPLGRFGVGLLHGRMLRDAREDVMGQFRSGRFRLMVATSMAEVGIDVPAASVMIIEDAQRFGLSQLHQMRGRIARSSGPADCFLVVGKSTSVSARERLELLTRTCDGFRISEEDLRMRGPGEFFGTRQHGLPPLRVADLATDLELLRAAQAEARRLVKDDPDLVKPEHGRLAELIASGFTDGLALVHVS